VHRYCSISPLRARIVQDLTLDTHALMMSAKKVDNGAIDLKGKCCFCMESKSTETPEQ
jgi:hypothetical protein